MAMLRTGPARGVLQLTTANGFGAVVATAQGVLVARWLGVTELGLVGLIASFPLLVVRLLSADSNDLVVRYVGGFIGKGEGGKARALVRLAYGANLGLAVAGAAAVSAASPWIASAVLHDRGLWWVVVFHAATLAIAATVDTSNGILSSLREFRPLALLNAGMVVLRAGLVLGAAATWAGATEVVLAQGAAAVAQSLLLLAVASLVLARRSGGRWTREPLSSLGDERAEVVRFLFYNKGEDVLSTLSKRIDLVLLGLFTTPERVGYYQIAKTVATVPAYVATPLYTVSLSYLSRYWHAGNWAATWRFIWQGAGMAGVPLAVGLLAVTWTFGEALFVWVLGQGYAPAYAFLRTLLPMHAFALLIFPFLPLTLVWGQLRFRFAWRVGLSVATVGGFLVVVPWAGALGMVWVMAAVNVTGTAVLVLWCLGPGRRAALASLGRRAGVEPASI
ncbi:MAG: lipopolysaccharide biosynthesis protein [SAR202 cluster bacterium]|nr:lipopolysaccharide biosynthesis protein [SAR202 cluster bacterium]